MIQLYRHPHQSSNLETAGSRAGLQIWMSMGSSAPKIKAGPIGAVLNQILILALTGPKDRAPAPRKTTEGHIDDTTDCLSHLPLRSIDEGYISL